MQPQKVKFKYVQINMKQVSYLQRYNIFARQIRISEILPWDRNLILPMLSYPGRQVTSSCEIASKRIQGLLEAYFKINR